MSSLGSILQWDYSSACHICLECGHLMGTMTTDASLYPRHQLHNLRYSRCLRRGFPGCSAVKKKSTCQCKRFRFDLWIGKILWRRKWQPTPVFLSGKSHEQRSHGVAKVRDDLVTKQQDSFLPWKSYLKPSSHPSWPYFPAFEILLNLVKVLFSLSAIVLINQLCLLIAVSESLFV